MVSRTTLRCVKVCSEYTLLVKNEHTYFCFDLSLNDLGSKRELRHNWDLHNDSLISQWFLLDDSEIKFRLCGSVSLLRCSRENTQEKTRFSQESSTMSQTTLRCAKVCSKNTLQLTHFCRFLTFLKDIKEKHELRHNWELHHDFLVSLWHN